MAIQVTNYQCPACLGPLQFDAKSGMLTCEYCGSTYTVEEIEKQYAQKDEAASQAKEEADKKAEAAADAEESQWDLSGLSSDWGTDAEGMRAYNCPSCGAQLICEETTAATACPYCGNPSIVPGQFSGVLKPDYVIPFKLEKAAALEALKKHYLNKPFLPSAFKNENHLEEIKGVYVPFWLFDGDGEGSVTYHGKISTSHDSGNYRITETKHFNVFRSGKVRFSGIPVDASGKMKDEYMDSLEPYDFSELTAFSTAYLPGYLADKYDVSADESCERADKRAVETVSNLLRQTISGYTSLTETANNIRLNRGAVKYALLPVWLLNTRWNGKDFLFAMNGQTGKLIGDLPIDRKKKRATFWGIYLALFVILLLLMLFPFGMRDLLLA